MINFQGRFFAFFFNNFRKNNDEQIFTFLSFEISPILPQYFCDSKAHNLTEVWTELKNGVNANLQFLRKWKRIGVVDLRVSRESVFSTG